jgi:hypothetical protein
MRIFPVPWQLFAEDLLFIHDPVNQDEGQNEEYGKRPV